MKKGKLMISYLAGVCVVTSVCLGTTVYADDVLSQENIFNFNTYVGIAGFFGGAVLYEIYDYYSYVLGQMRRISSLCVFLFFLVVTTIYLNLHLPGIEVLPDESNLWVNYSLVLTLVFWPSAILVLSMIRIPKELNKLIGMVSRLSTSIYIWHWPVIYILYSLVIMEEVRWTMGSRISNVLVCGITLGFAVISALFLENCVHTG